MEILGIIPARGGSKRVPDKNIRPLTGYPLISYMISAGKKSKYINRLIVSTDSKSIAEASETAGAEIPFLRPGELAEDTTGSVEVIEHALTYLKEEEGYQPDLVILLQATSPLCEDEDIDNAFDLYFKNKDRFDSVISFKKVKEHPEFMYSIKNDGTISRAFKDMKKASRTQDAQEFYYPNGAIYIFEPEVIFKEKSFYTEKTGMYVMPAERSLDIDEEIDFSICEFLMKKTGKIKSSS